MPRIDGDILVASNTSFTQSQSYEYASHCSHLALSHLIAKAMTDVSDSAPSIEFNFHPSVSEFNVPVQSLLSSRKEGQPNLKYGYIAAGALVVDDSPNPHILLIQRSANDSMPNLWEVPGGGCDDEDPTILHSVARELREEAGLLATVVGPRVGDNHVFLTSSGKVVCKFNFLVSAKKDSEGAVDVKLDPNEHQNYCWATEEDVKAHNCSGIELKFTTTEQEAVILEAFETTEMMRVGGG